MALLPKSGEPDDRYAYRGVALVSVFRCSIVHRFFRLAGPSAATGRLTRRCRGREPFATSVVGRVVATVAVPTLPATAPATAAEAGDPTAVGAGASTAGIFAPAPGSPLRGWIPALALILLAGALVGAAVFGAKALFADFVAAATVLAGAAGPAGHSSQPSATRATTATSAAR